MAQITTTTERIEIVRHFRRDLKQEWRMGSRLKPTWLVGLAILGAAIGYWSQVGEVIDWTRLLGIPAALIGIYVLFSIGNAQIRARAQPFYHTLILRYDHIEVTDKLRRVTDRYPWEDFERVAITPQHFTLRRRGAPRGEEYMIKRDRLSEREERFVGERMVEL